MKFIEELNTTNDLIQIKKATYKGDFVIEVQFNDDHNVFADFKPFLLKSSHPAIKKYLDENLFKEYNLLDENLNWNDYDMIFPLYDIYCGKI